MKKKALIIGASGLVGSHLLSMVLQSKHYKQVSILVRKKLRVTHPKLKTIVTDFTQIPEIEVDDVFCCIGTTRKKTPNMDEYRRIDKEIPLCVAQMTKKNGATHFSIVSSMGANPSSKSFYLRLKGETESSLKKVGFKSLVIIRPSIILGTRNESRFLESIGMYIARALRPFIPDTYKGVTAKRIAQEMIMQAQQDDSKIILNSELQ